MLNIFPPEVKRQILSIWKEMGEEDKEHFVNQIALFLTFYEGKEEMAKEIILDSIKTLVEDKCRNLADIGIYIARKNEKSEEFKKAVRAINRYRFRASLPGEPRTVLDI
jgi:hypothetical protein